MKQNPFLEKIEKKWLAREHIVLSWQRQLDSDLIAIVLNRKFGFGKKRISEFMQEWDEVNADYKEALTASTESDYKRTCIDRMLSQAIGAPCPWVDRYDNFKD